jgi:ApaG protein
METLITNGIRISVQAQYQAAYSKPTENQYVFSYHIVIENQSEHTIQVLRRHWIITNSMGLTREVEGEGIIGQQPILEPGDVHAYDSWCPLSSPIGFMAGTYLLERTASGEQFEAQIPRFRLESPVVLN